MGAAPATTTSKDTNTATIPPVVVRSPPVANSQSVEIRHGQLPHIETEDATEQELEEEDCLTSATVTESTTTTDVVPSHVWKWTLDEVDGDEGIEDANDADGSEGADAASSNGADEDGDAVYLQDAASVYGKHNITPPIAKVQLSVTTATPASVVNMTPMKKQRTYGSYSPAVSPAKRSSEELEADDVEYGSPCK